MDNNPPPFRSQAPELPGETAARDEARETGARLRAEVLEKGLAIREGLVALVASATLVLVLALWASLSSGCGPLEPRATATLLDCRLVPGPPDLARLTYRLTVEDGPALARYCLSFHLTTSGREYWASDLVAEELPPGSVTTCAYDLEVAEAETLLAWEIVDFWYE